MSYSLPPSYTPGSDAIGIWPQNPPNNEQFDVHSQMEQQRQPNTPFMRHRHSEEPNRMAGNPNPQVNKGANNIFFKTRVCAKFKAGACRNGDECNFAHGLDDLRQPPRNWQELVGGRDEDNNNRASGNWDDDQKIIHKMKLCKKFYNGEECPYGERCNFLHEDPVKFRDDVGRVRESSAISIGTTGPDAWHDNASNSSESSKPVNSSGGKPVYWKTRLCSKWETTGHCPFGDKCYFAHGQSELQVLGERPEAGEMGKLPMIPTKPHTINANDVSPQKTVRVPVLDEQLLIKKSMFKWKGLTKINRIYADWLDD